MNTEAGFSELIESHDVVICAGPGGVGKTTCAAAIALEQARIGRRACVVTIDPAKRLADALGVESLTNEAHRVDVPGLHGDGELWALMLDTKTTFDEVVRRYAPSAEQARAILDNRLYRNISGALGGTQEYMAMEKLYELHQNRHFDVVVVDTPPTRHALDFLDAPGRLLRFLNNRVFRLLMTPTRAGLRAVGVATQVLLRTISKVVGGAVVADAVAFFTAFEGMEQGFRERAAKVDALLKDKGTTFVVVAAPRHEAIAEATFFAERLRQSSTRVEALVMNRMFPSFASIPPTFTRQGPAGPESEADRLGLDALTTNLIELSGVNQAEEAQVGALAARLPDAMIVRIPFLPDDVHDLDGLSEVGRCLFGRDG